MNLYLALPIGIDFKEIFFHLLNLAILLVGLRFLLYKPIQKFMDKRKKEYLKANKETEEYRLKAKVDKIKYEKLIKETESKIAEITMRETEKARVESKKIIEDAYNKSAIVKSNFEKTDSVDKENINLIALEIAKKVVENNIDEKIIKNQIDKAIKLWENDDNENCG